MKLSNVKGQLCTYVEVFEKNKVLDSTSCRTIMHMVFPFGLKRLSRIRIMYICMCLKNTHKTNCIFIFEKISALDKDKREKSLKTFYIVPVL